MDRFIGKRGRSRSQIIESLIEESRRRRREFELSELARQFFAAPLSPEEAAEREDWLRAGLETLKRDD